MNTKKTLTLGGWIVAAVAIGVAIVVKSTRSGDAAAPEAEAGATPEACIPMAAASMPEPEPAAGKADSAAGVRDAVEKPEPGPAEDDDSWAPPGEDPYDPKSLLAMLRGASEADKALGRAIFDEIGRGGSDKALDLVSRAAKSGNRNLQMLALNLLGVCVLGAGGECPPEKAAALADAAHAFSGSKDEDLAGASFGIYCAAAKLNGDDAGRRGQAKAALMEWKAVECDGSAEFRALVPDRYAFKDGYKFGVGKGDVGEWALMFSDVIENSPNESAVAFAQEYYETLTQTKYTSREDAEKWLARRKELKALGARRHADDADFDAEKWATCYEDLEREAVKKFGDGPEADAWLEEQALSL